MDKSKSITRTMAAEFIFYAIMFDNWRNLRRLKCADTRRAPLVLLKNVFFHVTINNIGKLMYKQ